MRYRKRVNPASATAGPPGPSPLHPLTPTLREALQSAKPGDALRVCGWIRTFRSSKNVSFLQLGDGSSATPLQVVLSAETVGFAEHQASLSTGASLQIEGILQASPGKGQSVELQAKTLHLLGKADSEHYPLQKKGHSLEFLREIAHLRPRSNTFGAVFRIRHALALATHRFFDGQGFAYVHTPIITASDCEGAGELFEVAPRQPSSSGGPGSSSNSDAPFFGRPASLAVSGQLNGEALAYGLGRIYTFGPTFRAENSNTVRHLSEFWMIEPEVAFCDLEQNSSLAEAYLTAMVEHVLAHCAEDLSFLNERFDKTLLTTLSQTVSQPFARLTYTEAIEILKAAPKPFAVAPRWGMDLQTEHERYLVEEHVGRPTIVTLYPRQIKAFYMYQHDDKTVGAMDVLVPRIGEIIGGSQREHRIDRLQARLDEMGLSQTDYAWYLDLHRFGAVPHSGFGLGFERLVMFCTGMTNIRDVIPFFRAPGQAAF
jgi:asparaginyl-tRNA synthetase